MPLWKIKTKEGIEYEGDDSPFSMFKAEEILEFLLIPYGINVVLDNGKKLIFFRRTQIDYTENIGETARRVKYFLGFQQLKDGRSFKCIAEVGDKLIILRDSDGKKD